MKSATRFAGVPCAALLIWLLPGTATATPVTTGVWTAIPAPTNAGATPFDNPSWDGPTAGLAWMVPQGGEWLRDPLTNGLASFLWEGWTGGTDLGGTSLYLGDHVFSYVANEFVLDSGHDGFQARSTDRTNVVLLRFVQTQWIDYQIWFEDMPWFFTDADFNDRGLAWRVMNPTTPPVDPDPPQEPDPPQDPDPPASVPEPSTLALLATGMAVFVSRRSLR